MISYSASLGKILLLLMAITIRFQEIEAGLFGIPDFLEGGKCAKFDFQRNFDPVKYSGIWFDIESVPNEYQHTKKCVSQNYTWAGDYMVVFTRGLTDLDQKQQQTAIMKVEQKAKPAPHPAYMTVSAKGVPAAPYQIVKTDYRSYSCVYSCMGFVGFRAEFFWIFSREPTLSSDKIKICQDVFKKYDVKINKLVPIVQGETCPYQERLPMIMEENRNHLLKFFGPNAPTDSTPSPETTTTSTMSDEEMELTTVKNGQTQPKDSDEDSSTEEEAAASSHTPSLTTSISSCTSVSIILLLVTQYLFSTS